MSIFDTIKNAASSQSPSDEKKSLWETHPEKVVAGAILAHGIYSIHKQKEEAEKREQERKARWPFK